jgi:geranylgeranyl reductase family protein
MDDYDVTIVGAGPAGAHAAFRLASAGARVALLDREAFPRDKVCGGGLSRKSLDLLGCDLGDVIEEAITGAYITYRNRAVILKDMPSVVGATVRRSALDDFLVRRAVSAGAEFFPRAAFVRCEQDGQGVTTTVRDGRTFRSSWLLAADGVGSAVRQAVFGRGAVTYAPALEALLYVSQEDIARFRNRVLFDLGGTERGYGWIFPKRDHLNVGVYSVFGARQLHRELDRFVARYASLARVERQVRVGYPIPLRNVAGVYERGRVWLLGDAAGCAESVYGEGIYFALKSADLAAEAIAGAGAAPGAGRYQAAVKRSLEPQLRYSERIAGGLYRFQRFAFHWLARNRGINDQFAGLIFGNVSHRACFYSTLLGLPRWAFSGRHPLVEGTAL